MIDIEDIVRPNILTLKAYSSARDEFSGSEGIFLDANENPYGNLNRYPDPHQKTLKQKLAALKNVTTEQIFIGNGSDEVIDLAFRIFCTPGKDKALTFTPTYGMYEVAAATNDIQLVKIPLNENFQIDLHETEQYLADPAIKLLFICSPNNPTGNLLHSDDLHALLNPFKGTVIIDEAYIDFRLSTSWVSNIEQYSNLSVSQTFSKAWGLAAARVGVAYANDSIIQFFNKVKPPYNISQLNQEAAIHALDNIPQYKINLKQILNEKQQLQQALNELKMVKKIHPSDANFLLIEVADASDLYNTLVEQQIIIRNRHNIIDNCIRITVGTPQENAALIHALRRYPK
ncbi:MAG TPA: histidinol-phosphate transaminase [Saprospiraceae bacterium]|nr:histidinol-phosphate transaminase [Saprospiraceae bacterium]